MSTPYHRALHKLKSAAHGEPVNEFFERKLTIYERLRSWLFPSKHCFKPDDAGFQFKDCLTVHTVTKLDWVDRIRAILTGVVIVSTRTVTENEIGKCSTNATCHIGTWKDIWTASQSVERESGE